MRLEIDNKLNCYLVDAIMGKFPIVKNNDEFSIKLNGETIVATDTDILGYEVEKFIHHIMRKDICDNIDSDTPFFKIMNNKTYLGRYDGKDLYMSKMSPYDVNFFVKCGEGTFDVKEKSTFDITDSDIHFFECFKRAGLLGLIDERSVSSNWKVELYFPIR
jgi:hypothetical protein